MNVDFDFDTLYKNERKSLKEIFDTISQHIKTEDIINKLTENEKYYINYILKIIKMLEVLKQIGMNLKTIKK